MAGKTKCLLFIVLFVFLVRPHNGEVIVETNLGKVAGVQVKSIIENEKFYSFLGIPYARPPVGDFKFTAPEPHPGWTDVLQAKKERNSCAQLNLPSRPLKEYGFCGEEDCLHLNIHTPKLPNNQDLKMPVIVFLYNEHFRRTYNASKEYGPDFFMKEDVVLVTISHRIGSLGFLSFGDDLLPGNNGIRDIILALKFVQSNIYKFGGNPSKITLMGSEGGAVITDILLHSPKAKGLFSAAILQSGTLWHPQYLHNTGRERALDYAEKLDRKVSTSSHLLKELSQLPLKNVVEAQLVALETDRPRNIQSAILAFSPVVEHDHPDAIISESPHDKSIDIDIPIMIGYNSREGITMSERFLRKPQYLTFVDRDFPLTFPIKVDYHFKLNSNIYNKAVNDVKEFYFDEGYVKISKPSDFISFIGDIASFYGIDYAVRKYTNETSIPVYYYTFDYSGEFNLRKSEILEKAVTIEGTYGAATGDELCYLFLCKAIRKTYKKAMKDEDSEEMKVLKNMVRMWTNFAKYSNPTPPGEHFTWTPATKENKECLVIGDELQMKTKINDDVVNFWDNFIEKYRSMAVNGVVEDLKDEL